MAAAHPVRSLLRTQRLPQLLAAGVVACLPKKGGVDPLGQHDLQGCGVFPKNQWTVVHRLCAQSICAGAACMVSDTTHAPFIKQYQPNDQTISLSCLLLPGFTPRAWHIHALLVIHF